MLNELNKRVEDGLISEQKHDTLPLIIWKQLKPKYEKPFSNYEST